jgi:DNA modification methylase
VYEPFLGSGTTLIAAQSCNRVCLAIEIKPAFVDLAIRRWQAFTGEKAIRESDGVNFDTLCSSADLEKVDAFSSLDQTF